MSGKTVSSGLIWDFAIPESVPASQRWILSTMQSYGPELVTMLWRILGNEQDVCDAYQDTFLKLAHYDGGKKPEHVRAYVFRSANNVAISMLRHRIAERRKLSAAFTAGRGAGKNFESKVQNDSSVNSTANELDSRYLQETLRCCIAQLPEHLRNVVTLRDLAEMSYAQIGRILGITAATARVYRCKAIQLLAVWMSRGKEEEK
jgi:RNA polymerase sigma factor (sigma-70 family)